jgi:hypothetical protein
MNYTNGKCYILRLIEPYDRLEFQFVPKKMALNRNVKIGQIEVVGRNNPKYHSTGGETTLSFDLEFYAENQRRNDVLQRIEWLQALTYNEGRNGEPQESIKIVFGQTFQNETWTLTSINADMDKFQVDYDYVPMQATVSLSFVLDVAKDLTKSIIKRRQ